VLVKGRAKREKRVLRGIAEGRCQPPSREGKKVVKTAEEEKSTPSVFKTGRGDVRHQSGQGGKLSKKGGMLVRKGQS